VIVDFPSTNFSPIHNESYTSLSLRALDLAIPKARATLDLNVSYKKELIKKTLETTEGAFRDLRESTREERRELKDSLQDTTVQGGRDLRKLRSQLKGIFR
jgi:hypothetical protein